MPIATIQQEGLKGWINTFVMPTHAYNGYEPVKNYGIYSENHVEELLLSDYINDDIWGGWMWMVSC